MKILAGVLLFLAIAPNSVAQKSFQKQQEEILAEGVLLYELERSAWIATSILSERNPALLQQVKGYVSYHQPAEITCVFYNDSLKIIAEIGFDPFLQRETAILTTAVRMPDPLEESLIQLRTAASDLLATDTSFLWVPGTSLNPIPVVENRKLKVYILNGAMENDIVFGNDYLLTFSAKGKLKKKEKFHNNPIRVPKTAVPDESMTVQGTIHSHAGKSSRFITSTDICTLLLYRGEVNWNIHLVTSKKHISLFDLKQNALVIMRKKDWEK